MTDRIMRRLKKRWRSQPCRACGHSHTGPIRVHVTEGTSVDQLKETAAEFERLRVVAQCLADALECMSCENCDDIKCTSCVFREPHDQCVDDCISCVPQDRVHSPTTFRYAERAAALELWNNTYGRSETDE